MPGILRPFPRLDDSLQCRGKKEEHLQCKCSFLVDDTGFELCALCDVKCNKVLNPLVMLRFLHSMVRIVAWRGVMKRGDNDQITTRQRPALAVKLCLFKFYRERFRECFAGLRLCLGEGVGVDVQRGGGLRVPQRGGNGAHIFPVVDQQRGVQVPELVNAIKG